MGRRRLSGPIRDSFRQCASHLSGKTAIVTGSTAGIGRAIARGLAGSGARVLINDETGIHPDLLQPDSTNLGSFFNILLVDGVPTSTLRCLPFAALFREQDANDHNPCDRQR